jgi:hypothetical protein
MIKIRSHSQLVSTAETSISNFNSFTEATVYVE